MDLGLFAFDNPVIQNFGFFVFAGRCSHYRRRCKIRAPCCNEIFDCRHCHNEAKVCTYIYTSNPFLVLFFSLFASVLDNNFYILAPMFILPQFFFFFVHEQNSIETDPLDQHDLPRHEVEQVGIFSSFFSSVHEFQVGWKVSVLLEIIIDLYFFPDG